MGIDVKGRTQEVTQVISLVNIRQKIYYVLSNQKVTKVFSLVKMAENLARVSKTEGYKSFLTFKMAEI